MARCVDAFVFQSKKCNTRLSEDMDVEKETMDYVRPRRVSDR